MHNKKNKHLGIETDPEPHYIAKHEGENANGHIFYLIRQKIKELLKK